MKLALKDINPNPFKKEINGGKLSETTIAKIKSNIKELGLMGALPVFKKDNKYYLVSGHHRHEALKREFGKDYQIEVIIHNYNDDQALRGMVIENLTQRDTNLTETGANLVAIRKHLRDECPDSGQSSKKKLDKLGRENRQEEVFVLF